MSGRRDYGLTLVDDSFEPPEPPRFEGGPEPELGLRAVDAVRCICFGLRRHRLGCVCECHLGFREAYRRLLMEQRMAA